MTGPPFMHSVLLESCTSTQDDARSLLEGGQHACVAVLARHQRAGRGREGRSWIDQPGRSLLLSVGVGAPPAAAAAATWMEDAAASVCQLVSQRYDVRVEHDLPNDLVVDGRKLGGLLADSWSVGRRAIAGVVFGVGINLSGGRGEIDGRAITSLQAEGVSLFRDSTTARYEQERRALAAGIAQAVATIAGADHVIDGWRTG